MKKLFALLLAAAFVLAGCGSEGQGSAKPPVNVDVDELYTSLEQVGLPAMVEVGAEMRSSLFGIEEKDVKLGRVAVSDDGLRADEIWLIEAVDAEAAARIKTLAQNRQKQKDDESVTYSPEQNAIVKKAYLAVEGSYVFFITSPNVEEMKAVVAEAIGK